ncbi:ie-1 [Euproctis pseudoconspersa nucleopolyhedrovirus]|uniref:Ie-1 n=1 Tax=Euproctis pseudoconspersa nucleopolyhedrovirus TaxID=307467 RepID=C3TWR6_9ABAC|nr:ie-1 [Euproctis pseudoconspersa nucleopolyhedrovirus]ACO53458.1 ie-1 [Euproctis pseudoconspersa nucleopolyhedrovirus]
MEPSAVSTPALVDTYLNDARTPDRRFFYSPNGNFDFAEHSEIQNTEHEFDIFELLINQNKAVDVDQYAEQMTEQIKTMADNDSSLLKTLLKTMPTPSPPPLSETEKIQKKSKKKSKKIEKTERERQVVVFATKVSRPDEEATATKRKHEDVDENVTVNKKVKKGNDKSGNVRGRYFKSTVPATEIVNDEDNLKNKKPTQADVDANTHSFLNKHAVLTKEDNVFLNNHGDCVSSDRRFVDHMFNTSYYMFVVCKSKNADEHYRLFFANCVNSVTVEYRNRYLAIDNMVMVVSFDKFRFMISYNLLQYMNIDVPLSERFNDNALEDKKNCHFNEVKDFEFLKLLTSTFCLDMTYCRAKTTLLMASLGEHKAKYILQKLYEMNNDKSLYSLPFNLHKKEAVDEQIVDSVSQYVQSVINSTKDLKFKENKEFANADDIETRVVAALRFWLADKPEKVSIDKKDYFTYKYGSVVRLFYDETDAGVSKLLKIKKENNCTAEVIKTYLSLSGGSDDSHNCFLVTTKNDERITIIKWAREYIWITSVIKDIIPMDLINSFKKHRHYVFNLNKSIRKQINNKHNGMIKLIAFYTSKVLTFDQVCNIASNNFACNYSYKSFI